MADLEILRQQQLQGGSLGLNPKMNWSTEHINQLISLFRKYPCLYDRHSIYYNDKTMRQEALNTIAEELHFTPNHSDEVMRKINNLKSQFRREKHREIRYINEGNDAESAAAQIKWSHFKQLKFLDSCVTLRNPKSKNESEHQINYNQVNGYRDFDESLDEDLDYDCADPTESNTVGESDDCQIIETVETSSVREGHREESRDNSSSFVQHSPLQVPDAGAKRQRMDSGNMRLQYPPTHQTPTHHTPTYDYMPVVGHALPGSDARQERQQDNGYDTLSSAGRESVGSSQQSPVLQRAQSHLQQAFSCLAAGNSGLMRRRDTDDEDDEDFIFARYIASELRQLKDSNLKRLVKHQIQNLVFDAHQKVAK